MTWLMGRICTSRLFAKKEKKEDEETTEAMTVKS